MGVSRVEVGMVSGDNALVAFLIDVFALAELPPLDTPAGILHRLEAAPGAIVKVMVPNDAPKQRDGEPFLAVKGIRYLSMWVDDLDSTLARTTAGAGTVVMAPFEFAGSRMAIIADPDGNTIEVLESTRS